MKLRPTVAAVVATLVLTVLIAPGRTAAATGDFYSYPGNLSSVAPGTVLKTRTVDYHLAGIPLPIKVVQLLYRSADATGAATVNVTSVLKPLLPTPRPKLVSYQSFYDSLDPADEPSKIIAGGLKLPGGGIMNAETALVAPLLLQGYTVNIPDTEGQRADFAAGPAYGRATLDSLRAVTRSAATGVPAGTKTGLYGYSGGAIATEWAAQIAPKYAPEVNKTLVGASMGGVLVNPTRNLHYVDGTPIWSGVLPMALIGLARGYHIDLSPYLSGYGRQVYATLQKASIADALGRYPGLTFAKLTKPQYASPESIPVYVRTANKLIMGRTGTPTIPLQIFQGAGGTTEGTPGTKPGIGPGDGVMVAGDVRTLARKYCAAGRAVDYHQLDGLSHVPAAVQWAPAAFRWLDARFAGSAAPQNCADIAPGNPLAPITARS